MSVNNLCVRTEGPVPTSMGPTRVSVRQAGPDSTVKQVQPLYILTFVGLSSLKLIIFSLKLNGCSFYLRLFLMHTDRDECAEGRCQNNANCYNSDGSYVCICPNGWQGRDCEIGKTLHCNH